MVDDHIRAWRYVQCTSYDVRPGKFIFEYEIDRASDGTDRSLENARKGSDKK